MRLGELISCLPAKNAIGPTDMDIKGLAYHSGRVAEGFLFAAVPGLLQDGKRFIPEALARGASAVLLNQQQALPAVTQVVVPDVREALARVASAFYGHPSSSLTLIGITGTNGKTTTSYLIESILGESGSRVGVLGTVNYRFNGNIRPAATTTPESLDLQEKLHDIVAAGVSHAVLEVSSHALDLQRVRGCDFDLAVFTNLTRDHLDYHGSMENYFLAKQSLFTGCLGESRKSRRLAVVNADDPRGEELAGSARGLVWRYGIRARREVWPEAVESGPDGLRARVVTPRGKLEITSPLIGTHNLYNILAAVSAGALLELPPAALTGGIEKLRRVPGRLERVPGSEAIRVFVDYAHTPDALDRVLEVLNRIRPGRLIVVFGCGGDRDRGKRPVMGRLAAEASHLAVVTSDNPRTEDPLQILSEVERGVLETGRRPIPEEALSRGDFDSGYAVIPDRREAIRLAVHAARPGDVVLIAGKGHEDYQILGNRKIHFDDREEAAKALVSAGERDHR